MTYDPNGTLTPDDYTGFQQSKRRVNDNYWLGQQQLQRQQGNVGNQYQRNLGDVTLQYDRMREKMPWGFGAHGLLNSGVYQHALSNYGVDREKTLGNLAGQYQDQLGNVQLGLGQLGTTRDQALADLEEQQAARIATIAAQLRAAQGIPS